MNWGNIKSEKRKSISEEKNNDNGKIVNIMIIRILPQDKKLQLNIADLNENQ